MGILIVDLQKNPNQTSNKTPYALDNEEPNFLKGRLHSRGVTEAANLFDSCFLPRLFSEAAEFRQRPENVFREPEITISMEKTDAGAAEAAALAETTAFSAASAS